MAQFIQKIYSKKDNAYYHLGASAENIVCEIGGKEYSLKTILEDYFDFKKQFSILYKSFDMDGIADGDPRIVLEKVEVTNNTASVE